MHWTWMQREFIPRAVAHDLQILMSSVLNVKYIALKITTKPSIPASARWLIIIEYQLYSK